MPITLPQAPQTVFSALPLKESLAHHPSDLLVVGLWENPPPKGRSKQSGGQFAANVPTSAMLSTLLQRGDIASTLGSATLLFEVEAFKATRLLLLGLGKRDDDEDPTARLNNLHQALWQSVKKLAAVNTVTVALPYAELLQGSPEAEADAVWQRASSNLMLQQQKTYYHYSATKSAKPGKSTVTPPPSRCQIVVPAKEALTDTLRLGAALNQGLTLMQELGNLPPNYCTPSYLAEVAQQLGKSYPKLAVEVLAEKQIAALKMGSFLAVAKGSVQPPRFIVIKYQGGGKAAPFVLVGKGITFDSGGISLKPGLDMDQMKFDMMGAATVLGAMRALAEAKLPLNVIGVVAACENLPSGNAVKPGDVVTSMSGQTIEILNTDAEGRLILCDALTFVERFKPQGVIDIATLTGACVVALGNVHSGLFSRNDNAHNELADALLKAGEDSGDTVWRMPLDKAYQKQLESNFADMANIGGPPAGSVTAACFLSRFTTAYTWAHLDIAGTAWRQGKEKGASGRPLPLLMTFFQQMVR